MTAPGDFDGDGGAWTDDPSTLPALPGAYLLRVTLSLPAPLPAALKGGMLAPGVYLYAGSARGPGGIRARCARHLRRDKTRRWHIDALTSAAGSTVAVLAFPGGDECHLLAGLLARGARVPVPGFGASDCPHCPAHLVQTAP